MESVTLVGLAAGFCTTWGMLPQAVKAWKTKKTRDISLLMYLIIGIGVLLWILYGSLIQDLPIVLWNCIGLLLILATLIPKMRYG